MSDRTERLLASCKLGEIFVHISMNGLTWLSTKAGAPCRVPAVWLRDNCGCLMCGRRDSGTRFSNLITDRAQHLIVEAAVSEGKVSLRWADGHQTDYDLRWLLGPTLAVEMSPNPWKAGFVVRRITAHEGRLAADSFEALHLALQHAGVAIVEQVGGYDATEAFANQLGYIRRTHFPLVTDLKPREAGSHIADYPVAIAPHSDESYRESPIELNLFHCIRPADFGGETLLVDGLWCARELQRTKPESHDYLTKTRIRHERLAAGQLLVSEKPALHYDTLGRLLCVRLNERTMSRVGLDCSNIVELYRHLEELFKIAYSEQARVVCRLRPGEVLVLDNRRVLHGRTEFAGERLLRQTNVAWDEFCARARLFRERRLGLVCG